jgi:GNAT superfamily N-acetyltransferase
MTTHSGVEIKQVATLTDDQRRQLFGWGDNIFNTVHLALTYRATADTHFLLFANGHGPLSHAAVLKHHAPVNGQSALIGGLGGVVTIPEAQRRGHAATLVNHAADFLRRQWNVDLALLFCIDPMVHYYEKLGWHTVTCPVLIDQPGGKIPSPFHVMTLPFDERFRVIESIDLGSPSW